MEFCPDCGTLLHYMYPNLELPGRFSCSTCPYMCPIDPQVKIKRHVQLVKKPIEPIFSHSDRSIMEETTSVSCPECNHGKVRFKQIQTRSADEPMTTFYYCVNCIHTWRED